MRDVCGNKEVKECVMIGRLEEVSILSSLYNSSAFEYLVMYGRRRVGKTTLLQEFSKDKK